MPELPREQEEELANEAKTEPAADGDHRNGREQANTMLSL